MSAIGRFRSAGPAVTSRGHEGFHRLLPIDDGPGVTVQSRGEPLQPSDRELSLPKLQMADLLVGGADGGGELLEGQTPRLAKRPQVVQQRRTIIPLENELHFRSSPTRYITQEYRISPRARTNREFSRASPVLAVSHAGAIQRDLSSFVGVSIRGGQNGRGGPPSISDAAELGRGRRGVGRRHRAHRSKAVKPAYTPSSEGPAPLASVGGDDGMFPD